jgi:hypothetical protein
MLQSYEAACPICGTKHQLTQLYEGQGFDLWAKCPTCRDTKVIERDGYYHINTFSIVGDILIWKPSEVHAGHYIELPENESRLSYGIESMGKFSKALQEVVEFVKELDKKSSDEANHSPAAAA